MDTIIASFEDRVKEVDLYFATLGLLYKPNAKLKYTEDSNEIETSIDSEFLKILKANTFLMVYNLIESAIREGVLKIYNELESKGYTYERVREEIRAIWIDYNYGNVYDQNANFNSYRDQAKKLIDHVINKSVIKLDRRAIPISGNLDADQIRIICDLHGIKKTVDPACNGGHRLSLIKLKRNELSHGSLSFSECGRDFTENDLSEMKNEAVIFVRGILYNIKEFIDNGLYDNTKVII